MDQTLQHNVIVCIHNSLDDVHQCLSSLRRYWDAEGLSSLILVDDNSEPDTTKYLQAVANEFEPAHLIRLDEQHFYTKAANTGLQFSNGDLHTLLNSDTIVTPNWAQSIRSIFINDKNVGIAGPLSNAASTQSLPMIKSENGQTAINRLPEAMSPQNFSSVVAQFAAGIPIPYVPVIHGFCYTIHDKVIKKIGYLDDENFPTGYGEENDYSFRCEDAGFALAIALNSFVFHSKSKSYQPEQQQDFTKAGQQALSDKYSSRRIKNAIDMMENHPSLVAMRKAVYENWPDHEWTASYQQ